MTYRSSRCGKPGKGHRSRHRRNRSGLVYSLVEIFIDGVLYKVIDGSLYKECARNTFYDTGDRVYYAPT